MNALGTHLLLELKDCGASELLNNARDIEKVMVDAAKYANATVLGSNFHTFNPYGVSGVVIIAESHLTIHTWPEYNYAAVDIFTCGEIIEPKVAAEFLIEKFESSNPSFNEMKRGVLTKYWKDAPPYKPVEKGNEANDGAEKTQLVF